MPAAGPRIQAKRRKKVSDAARELRRLKPEGLIEAGGRYALEVTAKNPEDPALHEQVRAALARAGLKPDQVRYHQDVGEFDA